MLQAWFDDSGKGQDPVYLLAGYVAEAEVWKQFDLDWQAELDKEPRLPYLHARESQLFKGMSADERIERILRLVQVIDRYKLQAHAFILEHAVYREFFHFCATHPRMTQAERRVFKNPYFVSFQRTLTMMLARQAKHEAAAGIAEPIEILFDHGIDRPDRLRVAFEAWVNAVRRHEPTWLKLLVNTSVEFRDDVQCLPLQASDLLAWHIRRFFHESVQGRSHAGDPIWRELHRIADPRIQTLRADDFAGMLLQMRADTWRGLI